MIKFIKNIWFNLISFFIIFKNSLKKTSVEYKIEKARDKEIEELNELENKKRLDEILQRKQYIIEFENDFNIKVEDVRKIMYHPDLKSGVEYKKLNS